MRPAKDYVKVSVWTARAALALFERNHEFGGSLSGASELRQVLAEEKPKPKKEAAAQKKRTQKRKTAAEKRLETRDLWTQAAHRAGGVCEACRQAFSPSDPPELDHARGRGRFRQAISNVWLIHRSCHRNRHAGRPSRERWLNTWATHCRKYGYADEAFDADAKREAAALSRKAAAVGKAARHV